VPNQGTNLLKGLWPASEGKFSITTPKHLRDKSFFTVNKIIMQSTNVYTKFDTQEFPVVVITFTGNEPTDENFRAYLDETYHLYDREEALAIVFDATHAPLPGFKYQKMQADWLKKHESLMKEYCRGTAYVIANSLVRNVLKAIFTLQKQPAPYTIVSNLQEARSWAEDKLD
jgi:hypothetical protein